MFDHGFVILHGALRGEEAHTTLRVMVTKEYATGSEFAYERQAIDA